MPKPRKAQDPAGTYADNPKSSARATAPVEKATAPAGSRYADPTDFRKTADKVFQAHHELFRKLAQ